MIDDVLCLQTKSYMSQITYCEHLQIESSCTSRRFTVYSFLYRSCFGVEPGRLTSPIALRYSLHVDAAVL